MTLAPPRVTPRTPARPSTPRNREAWVDVAKGVAILLVVLFHAGGYASKATAGGRAWDQVNVVLVSARMPLFFLVSGLFVGAALRAGPARRYLRRKVWPPAYLFGLWTLAYAGLHLATAGAVGEPVLDSLTMQTTLWYVAGLALHLAVAWLLRPVHPGVQIAGAALLAVPFAVWLPFELGGLAHIPQYLVFFLVGCHARPFVTRLVRDARWLRTLAFVTAGGVLLAGAVLLRRYLPDVQELQAAVIFGLLPLAAVPTVLIVCHAISGRATGRGLGWLGRHTLPVFLLHPLALQLFELVGSRQAGEVGLVAWVLPPLLAVAALAVSMLVWHVLEMAAPWLFAPTVRAGRHSAVRGRRRPVVGPGPDRAGVDASDVTAPLPAVRPGRDARGADPWAAHRRPPASSADDHGEFRGRPRRVPRASATGTVRSTDAAEDLTPAFGLPRMPTPRRPLDAAPVTVPGGLRTVAPPVPITAGPPPVRW